jgi:hypothetical protein
MTTAVCAFSLALGLGVFVWLALPALRDGRTTVGVVVTACSALAVLLGVAGLVVQARARRQRP